MNNRQLYLAWLRTAAPSIYASAFRKATGQIRSLGGLSDDLISRAFAPDLRHSFLGDDTLDPITVTAPSFDTGSVALNPMDTINITDFSPDTGFDASGIAAPTMVAIDSGTAVGVPAAAPATPAVSNSVWASILTSVAAIGAGVVTSSNASKLVALNTQRAAQGLGPVNAAGQLIGPASVATTSPTLLAFEKAISGAGGSMLPILAVLGIGAFFLLRKKS